ncbi:hypothetical protein LDY03_19175, partial [Acinetobacter baumannii]|uniref:hypothetical protein n=1 Tax=Acinetobacter baumannii TaxID=470 RepID=UPI001CDC7738
MTSISLINFYSSGKLPASSLACFKVLLQNHMLIIWKIFCILLLSLGAFGVGLGISYLDFFLFFIGLLFLLCFFLALKQA